MTTGNGTNKGQTWGAPIHIWVFSYLPCDRRDRVLFRTARRNYYPAAWEFATAREPKHYNLPFRKFLRLSKPRSWTVDPEHVKYRSILLGPLAHAGIVIELCSACKYFQEYLQLFIKVTHSFVAIELLNFCKNTKKHFIAQEISHYFG